MSAEIKRAYEEMCQAPQPEKHPVCEGWILTELPYKEI